MFNLDNEMQTLQSLIQNNHLDEIKDLMYETEKKILLLSGDPSQIKTQEETLRSEYRNKVKLIQDQYNQSIKNQWEIIKKGLLAELDSPNLDLNNNKKTPLLWELVEKRKFAFGYKAMIEEFKSLLPLISQ